MADIKVEIAADNSAVVQNTNASSQPNNPLSRKLNKILETRLDNDKVNWRRLASCELANCS